MEIEHLREFVALAKSLSISSAAKALHVVPSTLSKHVAMIESDLGVQLLHRTGTGVRLTSAGRTFLEWASGTVESHDHTVKAIRKSIKEQLPVVRVGGNLRNKMSSDLVEAAISIITRRQMPVKMEVYAPHVSRSILVIAANDPYEALCKGLIDVSILADCEGRDWKPFARKCLCRDPFAVFVPLGDPLAQRDSISLADFDGRTVARSQGFENYVLRVEEACRLSGAKVISKIRAAESEGEYCVARDNDVLIMPHSTSPYVVAPPDVSGLVRVNVEDPNAYYEFCAFYREDSTNPGIPVFLEALASAAEIAKDEDG